jgi:hypothetical protein
MLTLIMLALRIRLLAGRTDFVVFKALVRIMLVEKLAADKRV